jgi:hypothetical protein
MKYLPWLLLVALAFGYGCERHGQGELKERLKNLSTENDSLKKQGVVLQQVVRVDTLRLRSVRRITDTVEIAAPIRKLIADERAACDAAIGSLVTLCANKDQQITNLNRQIQTIKKQRPSRIGCVVGAAVNPKGAGPGAACGLRL